MVRKSHSYVMIQRISSERCSKKINIFKKTNAIFGASQIKFHWSISGSTISFEASLCSKMMYLCFLVNIWKIFSQLQHICGYRNNINMARWEVQFMCIFRVAVVKIKKEKIREFSNMRMSHTSCFSTKKKSFQTGLVAKDIDIPCCSCRCKSPKRHWYVLREQKNIVCRNPTKIWIQ